MNDPPSGDVDDGDYSVIWWNGQEHTKLLGDLQSFGKRKKPEALLPLYRTDTKLRVLLLFDGPKEGEPRQVDLELP